MYRRSQILLLFLFFPLLVVGQIPFSYEKETKKIIRFNYSGGPIGVPLILELIEAKTTGWGYKVRYKDYQGVDHMLDHNSRLLNLPALIKELEAHHIWDLKDQLKIPLTTKKGYRLKGEPEAIFHSARDGNYYQIEVYTASQHRSYAYYMPEQNLKILRRAQLSTKEHENLLAILKSVEHTFHISGFYLEAQAQAFQRESARQSKTSNKP